MRFFKTVLLLCIASMVSLGARAQYVITVNQGGVDKEVIVLQAAYYTDSSFKLITSEKTGKVDKQEQEPENFMSQLQQLATAVAAKGGNVLKLSRVQDRKQTGNYRMWGDGYYIAQFQQLKDKTEVAHTRKMQESYAYITIYRPAYTGGFSDDSVGYYITVNDTLRLHVSAAMKFVLKVAKEGSVRIAVAHKSFTQSVVIDAQKGNEYFVRSYANVPGAGKHIKAGDMKVLVRGYTPYLERIDITAQGEMESAMIETVMTKKL